MVLPPSHRRPGQHMQLLARGPQDAYLMGDDDDAATFWRSVVRQHTPFAVEAVEADPYDSFRFGRRNRVRVPKSGDALADVVLEIRLPVLRDAAGAPVLDATWADRVGYVLLRRVRLLIDDLVIHDQERLWYDMSDKLFARAGHVAALDEMLGSPGLSVSREHVVHVPLKFLCCKAHHERRGMLPLLAMHLSTVCVDIEAESFAQCVTGPGSRRCTEPATLDVRVLCDLVSMDTDERQSLLTRGPVDIQFHAQQDMDAVNYIATDDRAFVTQTVTVDLSEVNRPVTFLAWVAYDETPKDLFSYYPASAVREASLSFNTKERFSPRPGAHFVLQQRFGACRRCAPDGVGVYSFALDASERQPSGTANFSALEVPSLRAALDAPGAARAKLKVFAEHINWLVCSRGRATLRFS